MIFWVGCYVGVEAGASDANCYPHDLEACGIRETAPVLEFLQFGGGGG